MLQTVISEHDGDWARNPCDAWAVAAVDVFAAAAAAAVIEALAQQPVSDAAEAQRTPADVHACLQAREAGRPGAVGVPRGAAAAAAWPRMRS